MKTCNGPFCKGKEWPEDRFERNMSCKSGRKNMCKMCVANRYNESFVPGICLSCGNEHECMFGSGQFCNRFCATKSNQKFVKICEDKKNIQEIKNEVIKKTKRCGNNDCSRKDQLLSLTEFYPRGRGGYKSYCKKCSILTVSKCRTSTQQKFMKCSLSSAKNRAAAKNIEFRLTLEDLEKQLDKQNGKCAISGHTLEHKNNGITYKNPFNMSLDRIDSQKGYIPENIHWVCIWIQFAKHDWNLDDFKEWIVSAAKHIEMLNI